MNSRERIELFLCNIKENTVIEASRIYTFLADDMTEAAFYKTLERFCQSGSLVHLTKGLYYKPKKSRFGIVPIREQDIVTHYIGNQKGLVVDYCQGMSRKDSCLFERVYYSIHLVIIVYSYLFFCYTPFKKQFWRIRNATLSCYTY